MKKLAIVLLAVLLFACGAALIACNNAAVLDMYIFEKANTTVEGEFELPRTIGEVKVTWSSDSDLIKITDRSKEDKDFLATVTRPENEQTTVTLTVKAGGATKQFQVYVKPIDVFDIANNYKFPQEKQSVTATFDLASKATYAGKEATITWSVEEAYADYIKVEGGKCVVTPSSLDPQVRIKAKFAYKGEETTKTYRLVVSKEKTALELRDYWYTNTGVSIPMKGWVVAIGTAYSESYGNISLYMVDESNEAGYYLYRVKTTKENAEKIKVGAYVTVTGTTNTTYNGLYETNSDGTLVVDESKNKTEDQMKALCYSLDNDILGKVPEAIHHTSQYVSLEKWEVTKVHDPVTGVDNKDLFTIKKNGVEIVVRTSKYLEGAYKSADDQAFKDIVALQTTLKEGDFVNVKGLLGNNKGYTILPMSGSDVTKVDAGDNADAIKAMPGVKAGAVIDKIAKAVKDNNLDLIVTKAKNVTLPATQNGVTVKYEIIGAQAGADVTITEAGVLTIAAPTKHDRVHVHATLTVDSYSTDMLFYVETWNKTDAEMIADEEIQLFVDTSEALMVPSKTALQKDGTVYGANIQITWKLKEAKSYATVDSSNNLVISATTMQNEKLTLVATIKVKGSNEAAKTKEFTLDVSDKMVVAVDEAKADTAYSLIINQKGRGETLFVQSKMSGFYVATTTNMDEGAKWYADKVEGGVNIYYKDGDTKVYLAAKPAWNATTSKPTTNIVLDKELKTVWVLDEAGFYKTTVDKYKDQELKEKDGTVTLFVGTSGTYNTLSLTDIADKKITADKIGTEYYPATFAEVVAIKDVEPAVEAKLAADSLPATFKFEDVGTITLPTVASFKNAKVEWSFKATQTVAVINEGKLVVAALPATEQKIVLVAEVKVGSAKQSKEITITVAAAPSGVKVTAAKLGLANSYADKTATVDGVAFQFTQLADYGDGIQFSKKGGRATESVIWNTAAFGSKITSIKVKFSATKSTYDNTDYLKFELANNKDFTGATVVNLSTVKDQKDYTVTIPAGEFTFVRISNNLTYAFYLESIEFILA